MSAALEAQSVTKQYPSDGGTVNAVDGVSFGVEAGEFVALVGPSGSGKGTICALVAKELGWHLLDSGALYRLTALAASRRGVDLADEQAVASVVEDWTGIPVGRMLADAQTLVTLAPHMALVPGLAVILVGCDGRDPEAVRTVLAGEISLASAIASLDWVSSHDQLGRNDPTRG